MAMSTRQRHLRPPQCRPQQLTLAHGTELVAKEQVVTVMTSSKAQNPDRCIIGKKITKKDSQVEIPMFSARPPRWTDDEVSELVFSCD